jgi:signal transduction protein with GAF and PtsI domain
MSIVDEVRAAGGYGEALDLAIRHFRADSGTIHMLEADGVLHLKAASKGLPEAVLAIVRTVPIGKGMAGLAVERAEPVGACNIQSDESGDVRPGARLTGMEGAVVVPILDGAKAVGALGIGSRSERTFTAEETALLVEVGRVVAGLR